MPGALGCWLRRLWRDRMKAIDHALVELGSSRVGDAAAFVEHMADQSIDCNPSLDSAEVAG